MTALLEARGLALVRGGRLLFEGLDLDLGPGGAIHVVGPNGCGKSSLLRLVAGLLRPTAGRIERAPAALADDHLALDAELPLERALAFWKGAELGAALDLFGLAPLGRVPVRLLSTGQARRARLARVAASGAPLWLLDEPLNGLDEAGRSTLDAAMQAHRANGGAILAASHSPLGGAWKRLAL